MKINNCLVILLVSFVFWNSSFAQNAEISEVQKAKSYLEQKEKEGSKSAEVMDWATITFSRALTNIGEYESAVAVIEERLIKSPTIDVKSFHARLMLETGKQEQAHQEYLNLSSLVTTSKEVKNVFEMYITTLHSFNEFEKAERLTRLLLDKFQEPFLHRLLASNTVEQTMCNLLKETLPKEADTSPVATSARLHYTATCQPKPIRFKTITKKYGN